MGSRLLIRFARMYTKEFDIRWSDLDANRHLANSAYINFMSATRMGFLEQAGFGHKQFAQLQIGPIIFDEHIYYFKEVFPGRPITVSAELGGRSEDGSLFRFVHNFYDYKGRNVARGSMAGAWMDLRERKITTVPQEFMGLYTQLDQTADFKILTAADTRSHGQVPVDRTL